MSTAAIELAKIFLEFEIERQKETASTSQVVEAQDAPAADPLQKSIQKRKVIVTVPPFACKRGGVK